MKPLNLPLSIIFTVLMLVGGAALASKLKDTAEPVLSLDTANPKHQTLAKETYLSIELSGVRSSNGRILVMVFDDSNAFKNYDHLKAVGFQEVDAATEVLTFNFSSLTEGPYAVFIMHDENNDYQLNESDGYPVEGFVVSGAKNRYDEPSFEQAAVVAGKHKLTLIHFNITTESEISRLRSR